MKRPELTVIQKAVLSRVPELGLPPNARVLDAPCGAGALTLALAERGLQALGADVDSEAQALLGAKWQRADLNAPLPWAESSFDAVFSTEGIEHLENRFAFLRELHRILKAGCPLMLTTPNIVQLRSRVRFFWSGFYGRDPRPLNESARHPLHHVGLATLADWRYALHTTGFRLGEISSTHVKPVSYLYAFLAPGVWLYTRLAMRKEKDAAQRERNREVLRTLVSPAALFGECLMLTARRD